MEKREQIDAHRTGKPSRSTSRRAGMDRRWIQSADHQPERRRGMDRRTTKERAFLEPLEPNAADDSGVLFPEIKNDEAERSAPANVDKLLPVVRVSGLKRNPSKDR